MRALDLFCGAGGVSEGLRRAGFDVVGVDIRPQPRHRGGIFIQADALAPPVDLTQFDFIWASPPCQAFTVLGNAVDLSHYPDLIEPIRRLLASSGVLTCIENVVGAPLRRDLMLCGNMFGLRTYRHRIFELNFLAMAPSHPPHVVPVNRKKQRRKEHFNLGGFISVVGDVGTYVGPACMGIDWMTGNELSQAIPPAYAEYIGRAAMQHLRQRVAA